MKQLIGLVLRGRSLRHAPVALRPEEQRPVQILWRSDGEEADVSAILFPLSLRPLTLGLARAAGRAEAAAGTLVLRDRDTGTELGSLDVEPDGCIAYPGGAIDRLRPVRAEARCVPWIDRAWHYALAWRHSRHARRVPHAFRMHFADLQALNIIYMMPRPTYLVSVLAGDLANMFPMDLVGPLGSDAFVLALRVTSPSVEPMTRGARIVVSNIPATMKDQAYALAVHHRERAIDWAALPFPTERSPHFAVPVPAAAQRVRELVVRHAEQIGSHMLFVASVESDCRSGDAPELCHVSDMYRRWLAAHGRDMPPA